MDVGTRKREKIGSGMRNRSSEQKPTRENLQAAAGQTVPDVISARLRILFCGINPGLYSGFVAHHFAGPSNRFWPTLYRAGFTKERLLPTEERRLLESGYGITNLVKRSTGSAAEVNKEALKAGAVNLCLKVKRWKPWLVAILGVGAYRAAFEEPGAQVGLQPRTIGQARIWILPNPSGLNAHYTPQRFADAFGELRRYVLSHQR